MVKLNIKKGDESQFLYETITQIAIEDLLKEIVPIFNGRLKVQRICAEIGTLAEHGIVMPPNMQGLTEDQITDLKLKDEYAQKCIPSGGHVYKKDEIGRRNGMAPDEKMKEILKKTIKEAKDMISKEKVKADICLTLANVQEALDILRGAVTIVYPMNLPPYDPIRMEFENCEDLTGTQAVLEVLEQDNTSLWWAGKEMIRGKKLVDFVGKNEKTKIICKIQKRGQGAPGREPVVNEEEQKTMMANLYKRQEQMKKLDEADDDSHMDSPWADNSSLKRQFQGLNNIQWGPGKR